MTSGRSRLASRRPAQTAGMNHPVEVSGKWIHQDSQSMVLRKRPLRDLEGWDAAAGAAP